MPYNSRSEDNNWIMKKLIMPKQNNPARIPSVIDWQNTQTSSIAKIEMLVIPAKITVRYFIIGLVFLNHVASLSNKFVRYAIVLSIGTPIHYFSTTESTLLQIL